MDEETQKTVEALWGNLIENNSMVKALQKTIMEDC